MSEQKTSRLSKVARELNVGIATIVDFLNTKGIKIDTNPNTKIEDNHYQILLSEFQSEKKEKEKSRNVINKEKRETITIENTHRKVEESDNEPEEILIKNVNTQPAPEPELIKTKVESDFKVKVVDKIDLSSLEKKPKSKKVEKAEEKPKPKVEEKPVEEVKIQPEVKVEVPVEKVPEEPIEIETIRAKVDKLAGTKVMGKIELPVEKEKKKDTAEDDRKKRKRKRIKKVDIDKATPSTSFDPTKKKEGGFQPGNRPAGGGGYQGYKKGSAPKYPKTDKPPVTEVDVQKEIKETLARLSNQGGKSKRSELRKAKRVSMSAKREEERVMNEEQEKILRLSEFVTVSDLAKLMDVQVTQIISACMSLGIFASINQRLDAETITIIADEFGYQVTFVTADAQEKIEEAEDLPEDLIPRSPIVTVMGHVDHGKTSLLDYVRKANVIAGEAGGITQHIGAYAVELENSKKITFLDTPGHEAFTAMRARGAKVTDIAIIVIAADDSVMPQTKEAIAHAQAAGVPMVFAINKVDKPDARPEKIREDLANMNILVEDWGGKYQCQEISAKKGLGINDLLEKVLLEAEMLELTANPKKLAKGTIIEATLDKGKGYVATILVSAGTLKIGDVMLAGCFSGRVKAMYNERGQQVTSAGPSTPVTILGLNGAPNAGDIFNVMTDEREARNIATRREQIIREQGMRTHKHITLDEIGRRLAIGDFKELNIIVKGDVDGSVEALSDSLLKLSTEKVMVRIIHKGVGAITESDILLASASNAIVIGFQVRPSIAARKLAETEEIDVRLYSIIYNAINEVKDAMSGMLSPEKQEKIVGTAEIRQTFKITKTGTIAGCFVTDGKITRQSNVRVIRDGIVIFSGHLGSLKRFKDDAKEVTHGYECGLNIDKFNDIKEGDLVEAYEIIEVKATL
jgi:translation initiation factor IF-2